MRNISGIRRSLGENACHLVIRTLVLSKLDYGNALLLGCSATDLQRLQRIQNWAAKLIHMAPRSDHATPYIKRLHWLRVRERITFKVLICVYKCVYGLAPPYLTPLLHLYNPTRSLRSSFDTTRLMEQSTIHILQSAANRTFSI